MQLYVVAIELYTSKRTSMHYPATYLIFRLNFSLWEAFAILELLKNLYNVLLQNFN